MDSIPSWVYPLLKAQLEFLALEHGCCRCLNQAMVLPHKNLEEVGIESDVVNRMSKVAAIALGPLSLVIAKNNYQLNTAPQFYGTWIISA
jgi:hypothetical protein